MSNSKTLEELETTAEVVEAEFVEEEDEEENILYNDVMAANILLKRAATLMDFVADPAMCRALSKRERDALVRLTDEVHEFTKQVDDYYEDYG